MHTERQLPDNSGTSGDHAAGKALYFAAYKADLAGRVMDPQIQTIFHPNLHLNQTSPIFSQSRYAPVQVYYPHPDRARDIQLHRPLR